MSQVWSKADADKMWNEGEVLLGSQSLSMFNSSSSTGTPPYRRPAQPDFEETWEEGGSGEVFNLMKIFEMTNHNHDHQANHNHE